MPQKTVIRPARSQAQRIPPQKVISKTGPNMTRSAVKITPVQMQRQPTVNQDIRMGQNPLRPGNDHGMTNRNDMHLNPKTRIYIQNGDRGYQTASSLTSHNSPPQPMYMSSQGKVTSPMGYQTTEVDSLPAGEQQNLTPKDERLSPNSTEVINAWEQSIKEPSPGSITFSNGRVQIHRTQVPVKSPQMQVKSPQIVMKSPSTQVKSPQMHAKSPQMHQVKSVPVPHVKPVQMSQKSPQVTVVSKTSKSPQHSRVNGNRADIAKIPVIKQVKISHKVLIFHIIKLNSQCVY